VSGPRARYRWSVLAAGTGAQAAFSAVALGLPALAPELREEFGLSLGQVGVVLGAVWLGTTLTLLPWGLLADRVGERWVLAAGLAACGLVLVPAGRASGFWDVVILVFLAGATGASVNAASGRAVMGWFAPDERGLALGIRQTAIPAGGLIAAVVLPALEAGDAFAFLAGVCLAGALVGALLVREPSAGPSVSAGSDRILRDGRLWLLCIASGIYLVAQIAVIGFVVLYLHDERGFSEAEAAAVLAAIHVTAVALRIAAGRWSDLVGSRVGPLRQIGVATGLALAAATALLGAAPALLAPAFVAAGALSMAWNGLSFAAAAELAGRARSGAALGFQQTVLTAVGVVVPVAFAAVAAGVSWRLAYGLAALFPLVGALLLRPLRA
jgi:sugar phosphate permease